MFFKVASPYHLLSVCFPTGVWCSAHLEFIQNSFVCVITVPKAPALEEMHHVPDSSLPLHPFLRSYLKFSLIFGLFFFLVWCSPFIANWILKVSKRYVA